MHAIHSKNHENVDLKKPIIVADTGLLSNENIKALEEQNIVTRFKKNTIKPNTTIASVFTDY